VLIDFGAARDFASRHSRSITAIAAPGYSPPEQYGAGGEQGPWTDLYALGAIAYRAVTEAAPVDSLRRLRKDPLVPATVAVPVPGQGRYSEELLQTIDWMLAIHEADRPQSVKAVREALRRNSAPPSGVESPRLASGLSRRSSRSLSYSIRSVLNLPKLFAAWAER
jgi:serine/threonine protein kinase